jgi:putative alpha-1,2-mannosidase
VRRWFVPHDPKGLIELFGGVDNFVEQLIEFFEYSSIVPRIPLFSPPLEIIKYLFIYRFKTRSGPIQYLAQPLLLGRQRGMWVAHAMN